MKYWFRYWDRDDPQDGRAYLDIWKASGELVSQRLIPEGDEDAIFELVEAHVEKYKDEYTKARTWKCVQSLKDFDDDGRNNSEQNSRRK